MNIFAAIFLLFSKIFYSLQPVQNNIRNSPTDFPYELDKINSTAINITIKQSPNDTRSYQYLKLDNGIRTVLVNDKDAPKTAVTILVTAGSNGDPDQYLGLAHYVEHVLFLGNKKYPDPQGYSQYIEHHGGTWNAMTGFMQTVYFLDIDNQFALEGLDRLAQFFIAPLFDSNFLDKERNAVNSEYNLHTTEDSERASAVLQTLMNPKHTYRRFSIGNLETLQFNNGSLIQAVIDFCNRYYAPDNLILSVLSPKPLEEVRKIVDQTFGLVPKKQQGSIKPNTTTEPIFLKENLTKFIDVQALNDIKTLTINFDVPEVIQQYKSKVLQFIQVQFLSQVVGTLNDYLLQENLIEHLSTAYEMTSHTHALLKIVVSLTENGYKNIDQVIAAIFNYLKLIESQGIEKWRFDELKEMFKLQWKFLSNDAPLSSTMSIVSNLQFYPVEDILYADCDYSNFSESLIREVLKSLAPENGIYMLLRKNFTGDKIEHYYNASYSIQDIPADRLQQWKTGTFPTKLPAKNPYLIQTDSIQIQNVSNPVKSVPLLAINSTNTKVWCMNSDPFPTPKFTMTYTLQKPDFASTVETDVITGLIIGHLVSEEISRHFAQAFTAGNSISVSFSEKGIAIVLETYSMQTLQKIAIEVHQLLSNLTITQFAFNRYKESGEKALESVVFEQPTSNSFRVLSDLLTQPSWPTEYQLKALKTNISLEVVQTFLKTRLNNYAFEAFIMAPVDCHKLEPDLKPIIDSIPLGNQPFPADNFHSVQLPPKSFVYTIETKHEDSSLVCYYQPVEQTIETEAVLMLLDQLFGSLFFEVLRTQQQLGYVASMRSFAIYQLQGITFAIESSPNTFTPEEIYERVKDFIVLLSDELNNLTQSELLEYKNVLKRSLLQKPINREDLYGQVSIEIGNNQYKFDRKEKRAAAVDKVDLNRLKTFVKEMQSFSNPTKGSWIMLRTPETNATSSALGSLEQIKDVVTFKQNLVPLKN